MLRFPLVSSRNFLLPLCSILFRLRSTRKWFSTTNWFHSAVTAWLHSTVPSLPTDKCLHDSATIINLKIYFQLWQTLSCIRLKDVMFPIQKSKKFFGCRATRRSPLPIYIAITLDTGPTPFLVGSWSISLPFV